MLNNAGKLKQRDTKLTRCVNLKGTVSKKKTISLLPLIHHKPYCESRNQFKPDHLDITPETIFQRMPRNTSRKCSVRVCPLVKNVEQIPGFTVIKNTNY